MNISIIDDNRILASRIKKRLEKDLFSVKLFSWLQDFKINHKLQADLYLIDLWLWDWSWFDLIKYIREDKKSHIPIIIISSYNDEDKKIYWLNLWADDYLSKIFSTKELIARIRAVLRRKSKIENNNVLRYKNITFDLNIKSLMRWKQKVYLTTKENKLVYLFMSNIWNLILKADIIATVWWDYESIWITDNNINSTLSSLRKKMWKKFKLLTIINEWYMLEDYRL